MSIFVDTNVLVYGRDSSQPAKQPAAQRWLEALWASHEGRTSIQVLNEYYVTVTRKLDPGLGAEAARRDVEDLLVWEPLPLDDAVVHEAWLVEERYGFSWWDSLVVAAARRSGCDRLLTEDLQHGQDLDGLVVIDPFRTAPDELLGR